MKSNKRYMKEGRTFTLSIGTRLPILANDPPEAKFYQVEANWRSNNALSASHINKDLEGLAKSLQTDGDELSSHTPNPNMIKTILGAYIDCERSILYTPASTKEMVIFHQAYAKVTRETGHF